MKIEETHLPGVTIIHADKYEDERGIFSPLRLHDLNPPDMIYFNAVQINNVFNKLAGTFRGFHYQESPYGQAKLVTTDKPIIDIVVDPINGAWGKFDLIKGQYILIPRNYAHGYLTLWNRTNVTYFIDAPYVPAAEKGIRWDRSGVKFDETPSIISERDLQW